MKKLMLVALFLACIVVSCASPTPLSTPTPSQTNTPSPTAVPSLTSHTSTPNQTATQVPVTISNPHQQLIDFLNSSTVLQSLQQYASAEGFNITDIQTRIRDPRADLIIKDNQGNPFEVVVDPQTRTPIFIEQDGIWNATTPDLAIKAIKGKDFFAGASLGGSDIEIPESMDVFIKGQFSANTIEGWHWKFFEPSEGIINKDYQSWDSWMINRYSGQILTGHPLYFPENNPDWLKDKSNDELLTILESHIKNIVQSNMQINRWVVVNEPNESHFPDTYYQKLGNDIYLKMFQWAHEANPNATLILNDYNDDHLANPNNDYGSNTAKIQNILKVLKSDPEVYKNVHVGMQMHFYTAWPPIESSMLSAIAQYGVPIDITELTVTQSQNAIISQSDVYKVIGEVIRQSSDIKSVTFWGIGNTKQNVGITIFTDNQPNMPNLAYYDFLIGLLNTGN